MAYSGSMESAKAIRHFLHLKPWPDVRLHIVHFKEGTDPEPFLLKDAAEFCSAHGFDVQTDMVDGMARKDLLPFARDIDADLIVMGNSVHKTLIKKLLGDTVLETIKSADRPLFCPNNMPMQNPDHSSHAAGCSRAGLISTALPLLLFAGLCSAWPQVARGEVFSIAWPWVPSLDIALRFRLDGLGLLFCLIVTGTGFLVTLFASSYLAGHPHTGRFFVYLHAFMLAMLGIVTADNLLLLFVFWEMTTIFSYLLIGFDHESAATRENARQALLVTGAGGLSLLVGILLIKTAGGSLTLSQWITSDHQIRQHPLYLAIFTTILLGAMTKSAQVPFHFWLPNAMSAPTPISAFLHAATMVKAGIYLLMRMHPLLGGTPEWMGSLVLIGGITAIWGAIQALRPSDLKRMLAYTTIMALGILVMFLGGNNTASLTAAATFLLVHALYKAALFLAVGSYRPPDRHPPAAEVGRTLAGHAVDRSGRRHRNHVHGRFPAVFRFHRQGDHVSGRADRRDVSPFRHDHRFDFQFSDDRCSRYHPAGPLYRKTP
jgi:hypothetical protein